MYKHDPVGSYVQQINAQQINVENDIEVWEVDGFLQYRPTRTAVELSGTFDDSLLGDFVVNGRKVLRVVVPRRKRRRWANQHGSGYKGYARPRRVYRGDVVVTRVDYRGVTDSVAQVEVAMRAIGPFTEEL